MPITIGHLATFVQGCVDASASDKTLNLLVVELRDDCDNYVGEADKD